MKKLCRVAFAVVMFVSIMAGNAFAGGPPGVPGVKIKSVKIPSSISEGADLELSVYDDDGVKIYTVTGAKTVAQRWKAFQILNNYMESGSVEEKVVNVIFYDMQYYGEEWGYSSPANKAVGYTGVNFVAGDIHAASDHYDRTWGGSSAGWFDEATWPRYVKLYQTVTINVTGSYEELNISAPPGFTVGSTRYSSTFAWNSDQLTGSYIFAAEHPMIEWNVDDVHDGRVTSCVYRDSADIALSTTIYRPSQGVRFACSY